MSYACCPVGKYHAPSRLDNPRELAICLFWTSRLFTELEKLFCNCFIYKTDSSWAVINWILINPKANKQERKGCLEYMIEQATLECKKMGFKLIDIMIDEKINFINKAKEQGYLATETLTRIIRRI